MLNPDIARQTYKFVDLNPSIIGKDIRWITEATKGVKKAYLFTVVSYEEKAYNRRVDNSLVLVKQSVKITTETGDTHIIASDESFSTNFNRRAIPPFDPEFAHTAYNYAEVSADIVGNAVMIRTGAESNHTWGQFITGKVVSFAPSVARLLTAVSPKSEFYEIGIEGIRRPIVVDSLSHFWA